MDTFNKFTFIINKLKVKSDNNLYEIINVEDKPTVSKMNGKCVSTISGKEKGMMLDDLMNLMIEQCYYSNGISPKTCNI